MCANLKLILIHLHLMSHKVDICKQCRPSSEAAEGGVQLAFALFAITLGETTVKIHVLWIHLTHHRNMLVLIHLQFMQIFYIVFLYTALYS